MDISIYFHGTNNLMRYFYLLLLLAFSAGATYGQDAPVKPIFEYKPLKLSLDDTGERYVRFIIWHQQWATTNNLAAQGSASAISTSVRRSRFLAYAQMSDRLLILTHFGLNNLSAGNLTSLGNNGDAPQLFLHDAWTEYKVSNDEKLYLGTGLHYWKGLTRLASASTLNFMTLDQPRPFASWHSLGVSDQFARHLGIYAKGRSGKVDYRIALNEAGQNGISRNFANLPTTSENARDSLTYTGSNQTTQGSWLAEGYVEFSLADQESIKLPYRVGSYLGKKRVINVGAGFFYHPNGVYNNTTQEGVNVAHFAADFFLDMPLRGDDCLNAYAAVTRFNYGENFVSRWAGTGTHLLAQVGYKPKGSKFMPYASGQFADYEGLTNDVGALDLGLNYFINGHNAKLSAELHQVFNDAREAGFNPDGSPGDVSQVRLQAHFFF